MIRFSTFSFCKCYGISLLMLFAVTLNAQQKATVQSTTRQMKTYPFSDPDPVARPGRVYPYFRYDGYTNTGTPQNWKVIELENDYIRLAITPEIGGKIWSAYEKSKEFPFIFSNHVVKFRDVALRGAWTSGGIEFNFGDYGHAATTSSPVDYYMRTNADGSVSCFIGATDWSSRTTWRVEINLQPDKAYFTTRSWWHNGTPLEQSYYNWSNAGFRAPGNLEEIFPGTQYIGHQGEHDTFPLDSMGRNISFYEQNNFGSYKSFHVMGKPTDFYGGFYHDENMGVGHYAPYHEKLGKKAWSWGLSREGRLWEDLLTDTDGPNVELQSGRLFNQASPRSLDTPFKHVAFAPYDADTWKEYWFPVKHTRGLTGATPHGAMNLRAENGWLKLDFMALEKRTDTLVVKDNGKVLLSRKLSLLPLQLFRDSIKWSGDVHALVASLGGEVVTPEHDTPLSRPLDAPRDFNWQSEYGLLLHGTDMSNQRNYVEAERYLTQALKLNPNLLPALSQMAQLRYRQGLFKEAREFSGRALSVNTYDGEANYLWGLSSEALGNHADAVDGFSVAALNPAFRCAALLWLANVSAREKNWNKAKEFATLSLEANAQNQDAKNLLVLALRKQGQTSAAKAYGQQLLELDPLNHFAAFENYLLTGDEKDRNEFVARIQQEMPQETFIELALQYGQRELWSEVLKVLALAPRHPMVQLWQAYALHRAGQDDKASEPLQQALAASPAFVFPFRPETLAALEWAAQRQGHWKLKYYEALIRWQTNQPEEAKKLFGEAEAGADFAPFFLVKAELFKDQPDVVEAALEKAVQLDPTSWRPSWKLAQFHIKEKQPAKALLVADKNYKAHGASFIVGLQFAHALALNKQYEKSLNVMGKLHMLPAENATDAHRLFRETNMLFAIENMKGKKWSKAIQLLRAGESYPENLGSGEPYKPDNRITQFMLAYCYEKSNRKDLAATALTYVKTYENKDKDHLDPIGNKVAEGARQYNGDYKRITESILNDATGSGPDYLKAFATVLN